MRISNFDLAMRYKNRGLVACNWENRSLVACNRDAMTISKQPGCKQPGYILAILACLFLNGCVKVGPNYKEPKKNVATHWLEDSPKIKKSPIKNAYWWTVFKDPTLIALINYGYKNNLSLQSTAVRVLQTRAQLAQTVGSLYPQQQAITGNYTYNRLGGQSLQAVLPSS